MTSPFGAEDVWELLEAWDGVGAVVRHDRDTGGWMIVALHDDTLGRPVGGVRMRVYPRPEEALRDALRLAEGMTYKWASVGLPFGGGKSVIAVPRIPRGEERTALMRRFATMLATLEQAYGAGEDLGTTPADIREIQRVSPGSVVGLAPEGDGPSDPGPFTARGVHAGIRAAVAHREGVHDLGGVRVVVQGVGDVGVPLVRLLVDDGAEVVVADVDEARGRRVADESGAELVPADAVYDEPCDVYAPCAIGATLNRHTIPRLRCGIVAGSANNQLAEADDALRLVERDILYAPDFVVNAGGALAFGLLALGERDPDTLVARVGGLGDVLTEIFEEAGPTGSTLAAARRRAERTLEEARRRGT